MRATAKNVLEEVQILEDSLAAQIGEDQVYVFSGKNANKYEFIDLVTKRTQGLSYTLWRSGRGRKGHRRSLESCGM